MPLTKPLCCELNLAPGYELHTLPRPADSNAAPNEADARDTSSRYKRDTSTPAPSQAAVAAVAAVATVARDVGDADTYSREAIGRGAEAEGEVGGERERDGGAQRGGGGGEAEREESKARRERDAERGGGGEGGERGGGGLRSEQQILNAADFVAGRYYPRGEEWVEDNHRALRVGGGRMMIAEFRHTHLSQCIARFSGKRKRDK
jgi:hypothetical protein